ncbi:hypothetical protein Tco_0617462 [Tanacetum coccineum]
MVCCGDGSGGWGSGDEGEVEMKMVEKRWCGEMWCRLEWWMPADGGWKISPEIGRIIWRRRKRVGGRGEHLCVSGKTKKLSGMSFYIKLLESPSRENMI